MAPVHARNGLVTARHPLAAEAGVDVLRRGGKALDAATAAILATDVVQPAPFPAARLGSSAGQDQ